MLYRKWCEVIKKVVINKFSNFVFVLNILMVISCVVLVYSMVDRVWFLMIDNFVLIVNELVSKF